MHSGRFYVEFRICPDANSVKLKNMNEITLIATATFGLEKVVKNEVLTLGFENSKVSEGKVEFEARLGDIPGANLWLRSADNIVPVKEV